MLRVPRDTHSSTCSELHTIRSMASVARVAFSRAPAMRLASRCARTSCSQRFSRLVGYTMVMSLRQWSAIGFAPPPSCPSARARKWWVVSAPPASPSAHGYERQVVMGDGQVSMGPMIVKNNVMKLRRLGSGVVVGMAGASARAWPVQCAWRALTAQRRLDGGLHHAH
jgi:hypothetical protein